MSERSKSFEQGDGDPKFGKLNYCRGAKVYRDPQLLSKRKVIINDSTSKQMYKFGMNVTGSRVFSFLHDVININHLVSPLYKYRSTGSIGTRFRPLLSGNV